MFKEIDQQSSTQIISELCGFITILSGTFLLHSTKDLEGVAGLGALFGKRGVLALLYKQH